MPERLGYYRPIKKAVTLRLDGDVLAWFKRQGRGCVIHRPVGCGKLLL